MSLLSPEEQILASITADLDPDALIDWLVVMPEVYDRAVVYRFIHLGGDVNLINSRLEARSTEPAVAAFIRRSRVTLFGPEIDSGKVREVKLTGSGYVPKGDPEEEHPVAPPYSWRAYEVWQHDNTRGYVQVSRRAKDPEQFSLDSNSLFPDFAPRLCGLRSWQKVEQALGTFLEVYRVLRPHESGMV